MSSVGTDIITNSNNAAISAQANKANNPTSSNSSVSSFEFLKLMTMQLQYQDPTNPMDNSEMLAQEAQFSTLEQMEALTSSFGNFANIYQANALMGKDVEITHNETVTKGTVDYVDFSDKSGASVSVNGNLYPLSEVSKVFPDGKSAQDSNTETKNILSSIGSAVSKLTDNVSDLSQKIAQYIGG